MRKSSTLLFGLLLLAVQTQASEPPTRQADNWPQWRGPQMNGVAAQANPPLTWSETENIRWKREIPGLGSSTPIVWGETVFITTAIPASGDGDGIPSQRFVLMALKRSDGSVLWQRTLREDRPDTRTHPDGTWASNSPVTDGELIYAYFGSHGLYALTLDGQPVWDLDLGDMRTRRNFGEGSSPVLHGDKLIVNWDHEDQSFIAALDKKTGKTIWKVDRDEPTSWSTPLVVEHGGQTQVIVNATNRVRGYDFATGKELWQCGGMTYNVIPSPVYGDGIVYVASGFRGSALRAIRLADAKGDITDSKAIVWQHDSDTPYVPSPLLYGGIIYFLKVNTGILSCFDAKTGKPHYDRQRMDAVRNIYASPVAARDRVYFVSREGSTLILKHGPEYQVLATNQLDDNFDASPAIVGNELFMRGRKNIYCIAEK